MAHEGPLSVRNKKVLTGLPRVPNHQLVVMAVYLTGGHGSAIDTEDIAVKANEIAPGRFSWRKYKDQINIETVRKRLWDATKPEKGALLIGTEKDGWSLTKAGYDLAHALVQQGTLQGTDSARTSKLERAIQTREVRRMLSEVAFQKISQRGGDTPTRADAERFFRIDDYVDAPARIAKVERFRIFAATRPDLLQAIDVLAALIEEGGNGQ